MSWSVQRIGKAAAVSARLQQDFAAVKLSDAHERRVMESAAAFVTAALAEHADADVVQVSANGHSMDGKHYCAVQLSPVHDFVE